MILFKWRYLKLSFKMIPRVACVTLYHFIVGVRAETRAVSQRLPFSNLKFCLHLLLKFAFSVLPFIVSGYSPLRR